MSNDNSGIAAMAGINWGTRRLRIEASTTNPNTRTGYERDNISDYCLVHDVDKAIYQTIKYLENGYWVEVYSDATDRKLLGPYDPNGNYPESNSAQFIINFLNGVAS